ncbi:MAG: molybdopterin-dependent oxidoreductase [Gammaproteobacteria bacterium]
MTDTGADSRFGFIKRRGFIQVAAATAAAALLPRCSAERRALGFRPKAARITPFVTANRDFYLVAVDPQYRPPVSPANVDAGWHLELTGVNGQSRRMAFADLVRHANREIFYTFECIGNPVGGELIGNARWRVMPLAQLLRDMPGGVSGAHSVRFEGLDDYYSSVSLQRALDDYAFIAVRMNGDPLPPAHGFPARVILPDLYGMKQPRWLRRITLLRRSGSNSYWERRGWAGEVPVKTMSRLDPRAPLKAGSAAQLTGIAFAGQRGISRVEVSLDGGRNWLQCQLTRGGEPGAWALWKYAWNAPVAGRHRLLVRATDGNGRRQSARRQGSFPDGASGYDSETFRVVTG